MDRLHQVALLAALTWLPIGCGSAVHYARKMELTQSAPRDRRLGVTLLRVETDGTAVIHVARTGETLAAAPGEPFLGERAPPYDVRTFGENGLTLIRSEPKSQSATLLHRWVGMY